MIQMKSNWELQKWFFKGQNWFCILKIYTKQQQENLGKV